MVNKLDVLRWAVAHPEESNALVLTEMQAQIVRFASEVKNLNPRLLEDRLGVPAKNGSAMLRTLERKGYLKAYKPRSHLNPTCVNFKCLI